MEYWVQLVMDRLVELKEIRDHLNSKGRFQAVRELDDIIGTNILMLRMSDKIHGKSTEKDKVSRMFSYEVP